MKTYIIHIIHPQGFLAVKVKAAELKPGTNNYSLFDDKGRLVAFYTAQHVAGIKEEQPGE